MHVLCMRKTTPHYSLVTRSSSTNFQGDIGAILYCLQYNRAQVLCIFKLNLITPTDHPLNLDDDFEDITLNRPG